MAETERFYVYRIYDGVVTVYVGKGSGLRLKKQMWRFGLHGEVLERFKTESAAYAAEKRWIKELKPTENKNTGGGGGFAVRRIVRKDKATREMERLGTRVYSARMLLRFDLRGHVSPEQIAKLREIANLSEAC